MLHDLMSRKIDFKNDKSTMLNSIVTVGSFLPSRIFQDTFFSTVCQIVLKISENSLKAYDFLINDILSNMGDDGVIYASRSARKYSQ